MNSVLADILATGVVHSADGQLVPVHSHIPEEEGVWLQQIIRNVQATRTLEIGLAFGVSALFICDALSTTADSHHLVIDPGQNTPSWKGIGLRNLERAGYGKIVEFHAADSAVVLPRLVEQGRQVDFAFIDGLHLFDHTLVDFFFVDRLLRVGGAVAFDDADWPSVGKVCRFVAANRAYSVIGPGADGAIYTAPPDEPLPTRFIAFRKQADDQRRWDFHRVF